MIPLLVCVVVPFLMGWAIASTGGLNTYWKGIDSNGRERVMSRLNPITKAAQVVAMVTPLSPSIARLLRSFI